MILTAITGSIGCGKTTISHILRKQGFVVYDIDKWVKLLYYKRSFLKIIQQKFPQVFEQNVLNKRKLRQLVFDDNSQLKILENLIHPLLEKKLRKIIRKSRGDNLVFVDVALLFEMGWDRYFDYIVLADVCYEKQKERVMKRDGVTAADFDKINKLQMSRCEKIKRVDFIVNTDVTCGELNKQVLDLIGNIQ